jgi:hypothetical protein
MAEDAARPVAPSNLGTVTERLTPQRAWGGRFDQPAWDQFVADVQREGQEGIEHFARNLPWGMGMGPRVAGRAAWQLARAGQAVNHGIQRVRAGSQGVPRAVRDATWPARLRDLYRPDPTKLPTPNFTDLTVLARMMEEIQRNGRRE